MNIVVLDPQQWLAFSDSAHSVCFNETGYSELERCDYALLVVKDDIPLMYATIKQHDAITAYMSRGGAFPSVKGTTSSYKAFELILEFLFKNNSTVTMRVENKNTPMLKFAMKAGFIIDGITYHNMKIYLEHILEVKNVVDATSGNSDNGNEQSGTTSGSTKEKQLSAS